MFLISANKRFHSFIHWFNMPGQVRKLTMHNTKIFIYTEHDFAKRPWRFAFLNCRNELAHFPTAD